jgi:hypothetical protein
MCCTQQTDIQPLLEAEYSAESSWTDFSSDSEYKLEMDSLPPLDSSANMMLVIFHTVHRTMLLVHNVVVDK